MGQSKWVHLDVIEIKRESDSGLAFLLLFEDADGDEVSEWIPKSMIDEPDRYKVGDVDCTISITEWIAKQKNIEV